MNLRPIPIHALGVLLLLGGAAESASAETITGTVTNTSAAPLNQILVEARSAANPAIFVANTRTNAAGVFTLTVPPGSYFVRTYNGNHYINQAYHGSGNLQCVGECNLNSGTPIVVTPGGTVGGINFSLTLGATISGTITAEGGAGLGGVRVEVSDGAVFVEDVVTLADGTYVTENGFPTASYNVRTDDNTQGYINELYPNVPCLTQFSCPTQSAAGIAVVSGQTRVGINISMRPGGRFSGRIVDAVSGAGLSGFIQVFNTAGQLSVEMRASATGHFTTGRGVPTGSYVLRTLNGAGYINKFNDGTVCVGSCAVTTIEPVGVVEGATTPVGEFALTKGGRVSGTIRDSTTLKPLSNVFVQIVSSTGSNLSTAFTNAAGSYISSDGLPSGTYYARTASIGGTGGTDIPGYVHELYDNVSCAVGCTATFGAPIIVTAGNTTDGIDFNLDPGGRVGGLVFFNGNSATIIPNAQVTIFTTTGTTVSTGTADATGRYVTVAGIVPGNYLVRVANFRGYINELYPDIPCQGNICPSGVGTPIAIAAGGIAPLDFGLDRGGRFRGTVLDQGSGDVVTNAGIQMLDAFGQTLFTQNVDALGVYLIGPGFPMGSGPFFARTTNAVGYLNELYPSVPCHFGCRVTDGTAIPIGAPGTTTPNINFLLQQGGRIAGRVTDDVTGLALGNVTVQAFNLLANFNTNATTDSNGDFVIQGLPDGIYYARTTNAAGYINESFDNIPCLSTCTNATLGVPLVVASAGTITGIDIGLRRGGRVAGVVTDAATSLPLAGVTVSVVDAAGFTAATATTDLSGAYITGTGIPAGNYVVLTGNSAGYQNELFDDIKCNGPCAARSGQSLHITEGATRPGIDFALDRGGRVSGKVTNAGGTGIQNVTVQILDAAGRQVATAVTDAGGNYASGAGLATGPHYARTVNTQGFVDELYNNRPCPTTCPVTGSDSFLVTAPDTRANIDFALNTGGRITGLVTDDATGQPLGGVTVQFYDATGSLFTTAVTSAFGVYTSGSGLPTGLYHARTSNALGYINELFGGAMCVGTCVVTSGTAIGVTSPLTTPDVNFGLAAGARFAGTVTGAGGAPLRGITVGALDASGALLSSGVTNAVGDYITTQGLPSGSYYLRTSNAIGYINELHAEPAPIRCLGTCDLTAGTAVAVVVGTTEAGLDFALDLGAQVRGVVTAVGGAPIPNVTVSIVDASGTSLTTGVTDGTGTYLTGAGIPTGSYFAVTQNSLGLVNEIFDNLPCLSSCVATSGTPIGATEGVTTSDINFALATDTDDDMDGIAATIDTSVLASDAFTDVPLGGSTSGTVIRTTGFTELVGDLTPGGVQVQVVGAGPGVTRFEVCATGDTEVAYLNANGETAALSCDPVTGSTTLRALIAAPRIELRDVAAGPAVLAILTTGQSVTMGSPVTAGAGNTQTIEVQLVDGADVPFGSFNLDAAESVEVHIDATGSVEATVLSGVVTLTVRAQSTTLSQGQTQTFVSGDVTGDGAVTCSDMTAVRAAFGKRRGQPGYNAAADVNGDGIVNILDLGRVSRTLPAGSRCR